VNHASLFSGIGGFDLAAEWMGWTNVLHCESNPFCQKVLKYHFPNAKTYNDVKTFDGTEWQGQIDILTGGFPCQPYSTAGKRLGKDDERHLWPEMCRIISEVTPAYVVGENVRGLLNWNGGLVFEEVCVDLENLGYQVWTGVLPAAGVGAPHRRERIWWVASNAARNGNNRKPNKFCEAQWRPNNGKFAKFAKRGEIRNVANANGNGFKRRMCTEQYALAKRQFEKRNARFIQWENFPTEPPVCGGNDGLPRELDGITFRQWQTASVAAYGNAIVPQIAYTIFQAIEKTNEQKKY
jgi:DNA (cytosine-5)-methyltransferase 1